MDDFTADAFGLCGHHPDPAHHPGSCPQPSPALTVNAQIGLPAYPGSRILQRDEEWDGSSRVEFESADPLERVYGFFHNELSARGWQRTQLERKGPATKIEADYVRGGVRIEFKRVLKSYVECLTSYASCL